MSQSTLRRPSGVSDATVQLEWRRKRSRRTRIIRVLVAVLVLALFGGAVWLVGFSSVLAVKKVSVTGVEVLAEDDVARAAAVQQGRPMARQDLDAIAERVRGLKPVESVEVQRKWPNTISVAVTERTPLFAAGRDGNFMIIDRHGVPFQVVQKSPQGLLVADVDPASDKRMLKDLGTVAVALPKSVLSRVDTIKADSPDTIELVLKNGSRVVWGSAEQSDLKATVTKALLETKADVYDVSAPAYPTTR